MEKDGDWAKAFTKNLGPAGIQTPTPPALDK
jgi:glutamate transport system substrate-binding protein